MRKIEKILYPFGMVEVHINGLKHLCRPYSFNSHDYCSKTFITKSGDQLRPILVITTCQGCSQQKTIDLSGYEFPFGHIDIVCEICKPKPKKVEAFAPAVAEKLKEALFIRPTDEMNTYRAEGVGEFTRAPSKTANQPPSQPIVVAKKDHDQAIDFNQALTKFMDPDDILDFQNNEQFKQVEIADEDI